MEESLLLLDATTEGGPLRRALQRTEEQWQVVPRSTLAAGLRALQHGKFGCVVTELILPDAGSELILTSLHRLRPDVPRVVVTSHGSEELAIQAYKLGAADYVRKGDGYLKEACLAVREVVGRTVLRELNTLASENTTDRILGRSLEDDPTLLGKAATTRALLTAADRAARSNVPILLEGETGTGKELLARYVHRRSGRRTAPFVVQNCAALSESLLETELFGHLRGAFTGADRDRRGLFLEAGDGTVFLDEIGEASLPLQAKLLRVLEHGEVKAVGADRPMLSRARFIAATNRALLGEVEAGRFRRDLYYRLAVYPLRIPPLRHRVGDIEMLATHFLARFQAQERRSLEGLAPAAVEALQRYPWPGNVRELENEIHRLVLNVPQGRMIHRHHLAAQIQAHDGHFSRVPLRAIVRDVELAVIRQRLREHPTKASAARSLGLTREALHGKLRRLGGT